MKVLVSNASAELVEKKSRFIANMFYVSIVEEAEQVLESIRKKYYDAKHNCYAYVLGINGEVVKSSDDGEPSGTAGHPMLDIMKGNDIVNCISVVTRYFGGILLGTGGLVRAYSDSLKMAIDNAVFSKILEAFKTEFNIDYDDYGKVENIIQNINQSIDIDMDKKIVVVDKTFGEKVSLNLLIDTNLFDKFKVDMMNITKGKVLLEKNDKRNYYIDKKEIKYI